jgi:hypothetical protein
MTTRIAAGGAGQPRSPSEGPRASSGLVARRSANRPVSLRLSCRTSKIDLASTLFIPLQYPKQKKQTIGRRIRRAFTPLLPL